ncbi:MAG TPA: glycoside hydrolase family 3 N-terminal domain-containing protein [Candidatus Limnocylindrales bacterium]|nr:glycoside hydrolase family 3 N-terminal domain-containing protein [Candidatus Limnocylindrales bacterium]
MGALRRVSGVGRSWLSFVAELVVLCLLAGCMAAPTARQRPPAPGATPDREPAIAATPRPTPTVVRSPMPSRTQLIGQRLVVAMDGTTTPSSGLLGRIRRGEVGGVILFGRNVTTAAALKTLTAKLQAAARIGGQPRLLIAVDQEGGSIKRIAWAPPTLSPPQMGDDGRASTARSQGAATGKALMGLGINVDLAPVADVPASTSSFLYKQGRTFSFSDDTTASLATAFAGGLESEGVDPTMKHFPGLGLATANTDTSVVTISASKAALAPGLKPYAAAIPGGLPIVMLSNATYTAYDATNAAGWSSAVVTGLLRSQLGFDGVTMTDSLDGTAHARGVSTASLALKAARAGTDLILLTGSEATSSRVFDALYAAAKAGTLSRTQLRSSYDRIEAVKAGL